MAALPLSSDAALLLAICVRFRTQRSPLYIAHKSPFQLDEEAWVETTDKVAGQVWITTSRPGESATRIEVVLIAAFTDGRISRVWETTWPSWNTLPAFETY